MMPVAYSGMLCYILACLPIAILVYNFIPVVLKDVTFAL